MILVTLLNLRLQRGDIHTHVTMLSVNMTLRGGGGGGGGGGDGVLMCGR